MTFTCRGRGFGFAAICGAWMLVAGIMAAGCGSDSGGGPVITTGGGQIHNVATGQGLIAIDDKDQIAVAPIFTLDGNGNAQVAIIDLTQLTFAANEKLDWWRSPKMFASFLEGQLFPEAYATPNPLKGLVSLIGTTFPVAAAYDSVHDKILVEASLASTTGAVTIYQLDPGGVVDNTIPAPGLTQTGAFGFGGIVFDPVHNRAVVGGGSQLGLLNTAANPPTWDQTTVTDIECTDSFSLNVNTQTLFDACDGTNNLVNTSHFGAPLPVTSFQSTFGTTDGTAFDSTTNIVGTDPEFQDVTRVFNFSNLNTGATPATAPEVNVPGLGTTGLVGEGPGGQLTGNTVTHQLFVLDEFGENYRLIQLPKSKINGALDNNGQPGTSTTPDAASAYTISAGVLPMVTDKMSNPSHLEAVGDPNSATLDQNSDHVFLLATDDTCQLWLVVVDLNNPPLGACVSCGTHWTPPTSTVLLSTTDDICG